LTGTREAALRITAAGISATTSVAYCTLVDICIITDINNNDIKKAENARTSKGIISKAKQITSLLGPLTFHSIKSGRSSPFPMVLSRCHRQLQQLGALNDVGGTSHFLPKRAIILLFDYF